MTAAQSALIDRLRALLADEPVLREVSMFGGRSFMVNEKMLVSALQDGGLLVRVDVEQHDELLREPGAAQAEGVPGRLVRGERLAQAVGGVGQRRKTDPPAIAPQGGDEI